MWEREGKYIIKKQNFKILKKFKRERSIKKQTTKKIKKKIWAARRLKRVYLTI